MRISIFRRAHFNSAHRIFNKDWSEEKNLEVFGKCYSPNYHGHNYELVVKLTGEVDPETGFLFNLKDLKTIIKRHIEDKFDHKNLNLDIEEFKDLNPTTENFCFLIWKILRKEIDERFELKVRLIETPRNYVEYPAD